VVANISTGRRIDPTELSLAEWQIGVWRCAAVAKGGRRFSFAAMMVVGNGDGVVGVGYGKARDFPAAVEKAVKDAKKNLIRVKVVGGTVPCEVRCRYGASKVILVPATPGTGVIAGRAVRAVCEALGIRDVLTKSYGGSNNAKNLVRATLRALEGLRDHEQVATMRGVEISENPVLTMSRRAEERLRSESQARAARESASSSKPARGRRGRRGRDDGRGGDRDDRRRVATVEAGGVKAETDPSVDPQSPPPPPDVPNVDVGAAD
jgi:small subunit ribosomal protein S5